MRFILVSSIFIFTLAGCAGTQKAKDSRGEMGRSNAYEPYLPEEVQSPPKDRRRKDKRSFRERYFQSLDDKKEEYEELMKENAKRAKKRRKEMQKPQYSDPMYFGHKNKPKKRKLGKRKFCKECGIVH